MRDQNERRPQAGAARSAGRHDTTQFTGDLRQQLRTADIRVLVGCVDRDASLVLHDEVRTACLRCRRREAWTFANEVRCRRCRHVASHWAYEALTLFDARATDSYLAAMEVAS